MTNRYTIADPHWCCDGVRFLPVRVERCGNMTALEYDEFLIDNWNSVVTKRDVVYLVGDVGRDKKGYFGAAIVPRLKGRIEVIGGNHDTPEILQYFDKVHGVKMVNVHGMVIPITHIPIHPQELWWEYNIHGHIHGNTVKKFAHTKEWAHSGEADPRYINVCVEHMNYTPQLLEDVVPKPGRGGAKRKKTRQNVTIPGRGMRTTKERDEKNMELNDPYTV